MEEKIEENRKITEAVLTFVRDKEDRNWISRLPSGKIVILHRSDPTVPEPNVPYRCKIQEKEKKKPDGTIAGYALAWIIGLDCYPRAIIKEDRSCILIRDPKSKPQSCSSIYEAFELLHNRETLFAIYRRENRNRKDIATKTIELDLKINTPGEPSLRKSVEIKWDASKTCEEILNEILKRVRRFE